MTKQEKIVVSAYTGILMCEMNELCEYIQKKFGRPVFDHELADKNIQKKIKEKSKEEFLAICDREDPGQKKGRWIRNDNGTYSCSVCQSWIPEEQHHYARYCLYCGTNMRG